MLQPVRRRWGHGNGDWESQPGNLQKYCHIIPMISHVDCVVATLVALILAGQRLKSLLHFRAFGKMYNHATKHMNTNFIKPRYDEGGFAGIPTRIENAFASGHYDAVVLFLID